ncbi:glutaminyl-peptide cyclotransferase [Hoyosella sp. YIM 151337]|uniref:glutaminyl-peptide cyclotransferase n=1 Tax=Hoyosella sp. YIM 151337 TaxID=2992742 RepID=UPI00223598F5|nr:glutaminyl-peptide cyclotransferase [Hoyosella sp. YIM 151337]MCW4356014.1 glutaminyl-peptide cyclotransferase [Hoyosella sp. YIM 151337]
MTARTCTKSHLLVVIGILAGASTLTACDDDLSALNSTDGSGDAVELLRPEVLAVHPHDVQAFTQGLEFAGTVLYESTGRVGSSWIAARDFRTGTELARADLTLPYFGEGLTVTDERVWQITWQDGIAFERDPATLEELSTVKYDGEGWGLCSYPDQLVMSDGSDTLTFRDPSSFETLGTLDVTLRGNPLANLNELECTDDGVYANVFQTDWIVRISLETGRVEAVVDAAGLLSADERAGTDVLNGIAAIPDTDRFLLTGKLWPSLFEVRFVPATE